MCWTGSCLSLANSYLVASELLTFAQQGQSELGGSGSTEQAHACIASYSWGCSKCLHTCCVQLRHLFVFSFSALTCLVLLNAAFVECQHVAEWQGWHAAGHLTWTHAALQTPCKASYQILKIDNANSLHMSMIVIYIL